MIDTPTDRQKDLHLETEAYRERKERLRLGAEKMKRSL